ncbi:hypothetical protein CKALI_01525 [Corynebacterium kalinowskii]|uniref:ECF transporter S component n=1 Tax=Corynebacterium kalinowskii TaxID=2675216 RepID=A0A6B8VHZ7_9CORY|nr:hypothetical protein [Corynebacterium kalinowskii]QGU01204.1 hypothetical protein CKALI_01525 [Corynebacterium kalinowskii]
MQEWRPAALTVLAVLAILASWLCPVHSLPNNWPVDTSTIWTSLGLTVIALTLLVLRVRYSFRWAELWPILPGIALNLIINALVVSLDLPIFLDTVGTIVVGVWLSPHAGAVTGLASALLTALFNPIALDFASIQAFVGMAAGILAQMGSFRTPLAAAVSGFLIGMPSSILAAPLNVTMLGDVFLGDSPFTGILTDVFLVGPVDKAISFLLAWGVLSATVAKQKPELKPVMAE